MSTMAWIYEKEDRDYIARLSSTMPHDRSYKWRFWSDVAAAGTGLLAFHNNAAIFATETGIPLFSDLAMAGDRWLDDPSEPGDAGPRGEQKFQLWEQLQGTRSFGERSTRQLKKWAHYLEPSPYSTGVVGHFAHQLFRIAPVIAIGALTGGTGAIGLGATAAGVAASEGHAHYQKWLESGVDKETARKLAVIDGLVAGAGVALPVSLAGWGALRASTSLLYGAGSNVALGMVGRLGINKMLRDNGYTEMADQYEVLDRWSIVADALLGGGFGALGHSAARRAFEAKKNKKISAEEGGAETVVGQTMNAVVQARAGNGLVPLTPAAARDVGIAKTETMEKVLKGEQVVVQLPDNTSVDPTVLQRRDEAAEVVKEHFKNDPVPTPTPQNGEGWQIVIARSGDNKQNMEIEAWGSQHPLIQRVAANGRTARIAKAPGGELSQFNRWMTELGQKDTGGDIILYIGSREHLNIVANDLVKHFGDRLPPPREFTVRDAIPVFKDINVWARFSVPADWIFFTQYGGPGIPGLRSAGTWIGGERVFSPEALAETDRVLRERYGVFYTGEAKETGKETAKAEAPAAAPAEAPAAAPAEAPAGKPEEQFPNVIMVDEEGKRVDANELINRVRREVKNAESPEARNEALIVARCLFSSV